MWPATEALYKSTFTLFYFTNTTSRVACLVRQSLAGQTPAYIADDIQLVTDSDRRQLRSAAARTCLVPRTHSNFGDRSFSAAAGPRMWNSLLHHLNFET